MEAPAQRVALRASPSPPTQPVLPPEPLLVTSKLQLLVTKALIEPNLLTAVVDLKKWVEEMQEITPDFRYYIVGGLAAILQGRRRATTDIDVRLYPLGDAEKLAIQKHADWALQKNAKKPYQIEIKIGDGDKVKVDAVLVSLSDYTIFDKHKLITSVEGINVANLALLAITKLETLAVRGNAIKLQNDYADLIWCLKECKKSGLVIPQEALDAGFPAGWTKMYTRLRKIVEPEQVDQLTNLLLDLEITPQVPQEM